MLYVMWCDVMHFALLCCAVVVLCFLIHSRASVWQLRRSLSWEHEGTRQLVASELLARTAKHVLACRLSLSRLVTGIEDEVHM